MNGARSMQGLFEYMLLLSTSASLWLYLACALAAFKLGISRVFAVIGAIYALWTLWGAGIGASGLSFLLMATGIPMLWWSRRTAAAVEKLEAALSRQARRAISPPARPPPRRVNGARPRLSSSHSPSISALESHRREAGIGEARPRFGDQPFEPDAEVAIDLRLHAAIAGSLRVSAQNPSQVASSSGIGDRRPEVGVEVGEQARARIGPGGARPRRRARRSPACRSSDRSRRSRPTRRRNSAAAAPARRPPRRRSRAPTRPPRRAARGTARSLRAGSCRRSSNCCRVAIVPVIRSYNMTVHTAQLSNTDPLEGWSLPAWTYDDPEFFALEKERVFAPSWQVVCHESDVPKAGDWHTLDYIGESVIVVRGKDRRAARVHQRLPPPRLAHRRRVERLRAEAGLPVPRMDLRPRRAPHRRARKRDLSGPRQGQPRPRAGLSSKCGAGSCSCAWSTMAARAWRR